MWEHTISHPWGSLYWADQGEEPERPFKGAVYLRIRFSYV
jgi:hypothetical protein